MTLTEFIPTTQTQNQLKQMVILAGGRGDRLAPLTDVIPKPLLTFAGKPFLIHLIEQGISYGFNEILLLTGYKSELIEQVILNWNNKTIKINIVETDQFLTTKQRLLSAQQHLSDFFCICYGDNFIQLDNNEFNLHFQKINDENEIRVLGFSGSGYNSKKNLLFNPEDKKITYNTSHSTLDKNLSLNLGWIILSKKIVSKLIWDSKSLEESIFGVEFHWKQIVTNCKSKYYSIGTLTRFGATSHFLNHSRISIILDRDGTLNEKAGPAEYVTTKSDFFWRKDIINIFSDFAGPNTEFYVVTNQPAVGRGLATKNQVDLLNSEMVSDIIANGGQPPAILACMHGWTDNCECRKPDVGLFTALQEMYDINWKNTIYIGDDARDREVAVSLNLAFIPATNAYTKISQDIKLILDKRLNPSN